MGPRGLVPCLARLGGNSDMRGKEQALVSKVPSGAGRVRLPTRVHRGRGIGYRSWTKVTF